MGPSSLRDALDAAAPAAGFTVLHGHALPDLERPLDHLVIGPMGVFTLRTGRPGRLGRHGQLRELGGEVRAIRAVLDARGLRALAAAAILCDPDGPALPGVIARLSEDAPYGPSAVRAARQALDPPPFVADVRREQPAATPRPAPSVVA